MTMTPGGIQTGPRECRSFVAVCRRLLDVFPRLLAPLACSNLGLTMVYRDEQWLLVMCCNLGFLARCFIF
jgi:hypothetical protein